METKTIRVLMIDDHPVVRKGIRSLISNYDEVEVVGEANDAAEGLHQLTKLHPDVVLLDIAMPGMDGLETLRRLKDQPESSTLPVIMVTAQGDRQNMVKAVQLGVRDYVTKPWEPGEVEMCVNWALKAANVAAA